MKHEEIMTLPVGQWLRRPRILSLVSQSMLPDGLAVMKAWGFNYKSNIVWHKVRKDGAPTGACRFYSVMSPNDPVRCARQECANASAGGGK